MAAIADERSELQENAVTDRSTSVRRIAALVVGAAGLSVAGGCAGTAGRQHAAISHDATPDLITLDKRPIDDSNMVTVTWNANWRESWDDWNKIWLLDRPSRLTQYPMPH